MHIIEGALAFALLMVVFSTVASGFAEAVNRMIALRKFNLRAMVLRFLNDVVLETGTKLELSGETAQTLSDKLTHNMATGAELPEEGRRGTPWFYWSSQNWVDELSTQGFLERFAKTRLGQAFHGYKQTDEAQLKSVIVGFSLAYDRYVAASQERYRKTSQRIAFAAALALALGANIHLSRLVTYLGTNSDAVAGILSNEDEILALQETLEENPNADVSDEINRLIELGETLELPILWGDQSEETDENGDAAEADPEPLFLWLLNCLAAGILIGLGAPYWYRVSKSLGQLRRLGGSSGSNESVGNAPTVHDGDALERAGQNYDLFLKAAEAYAAEKAARNAVPQSSGP